MILFAPELPLRHVTLPCAVISDRHNPAVGTQRNGMPLPGGDGADVGPRLHLALAVLDVSGGHYRPVLFHGDGVVGADGHGGEVRPVQDTGGDEAVGLEQAAVERASASSRRLDMLCLRFIFGGISG